MEEETKKKKHDKNHELEELNARLEEALNEEKAKSMRIQAEMINFKKRNQISNCLEILGGGGKWGTTRKKTSHIRAFSHSM